MKLPENWGKIIRGSCFAGFALIDAAMDGAGKAAEAGSRFFGCTVNILDEVLVLTVV